MFEAWSVAVRVSLINGVAGGLMSMSRQFAKTHGDAAKLQKQIHGIQTQLMVGGGLMIAGGGIFKLIESTLPAASRYANQLSLLNTLGLKQADIAKAVAAAWQTTYAVPTSTAAGNLQTFRELRSAFGAGGEAHAMAMLPTVARVQGILTALTGHEQEKVGFDMVKTAELRLNRANGGVMSTAFLQRNAELESRALMAMGGTITASDFHGALKMGKLATAKWTDEFVYELLPTLMQELKTGHGGGAQSAGSYLMTLYRQVHGRVQKSAIPMWVQSGLIKQSDVVKTMGGTYQIKPGAMKGLPMFEQNPFEWVNTVLAPQVERIAKQKRLTVETVMSAMFSDRNAAFAAYTMYQKGAQFRRDQKLIQGADSLEAYDKLRKTNPMLAKQALSSTWENVLATLGYSIMPDLLKAAQALVPVLQDFTKWMRANPEGVRGLVRGAAALGSLLTLAGAITIGVGTVRALGLLFGVLRIIPAAGGLAGIASGIAGIGGATVAAVGWPVIAVVAGLAAVGLGIWWLSKHIDTVAPKLKGAWSAIYNGILGFINGLHHLIPAIPAVPGTPGGPALKQYPKTHGLPGSPNATGHHPLRQWFENFGYKDPLHHNTSLILPTSPNATSDHPLRQTIENFGRNNTSFAPSGGNLGVTKTSDVYLDGHKVGVLMQRHQNAALGRPPVGGSAYDPSVHLTPVGAGGMSI